LNTSGNCAPRILRAGLHALGLRRRRHSGRHVALQRAEADGRAAWVRAKLLPPRWPGRVGVGLVAGVGKCGVGEVVVAAESDVAVQVFPELHEP